jgi:hypothetical protein
VLDQLTSFLFTAGVPRPPGLDPDLQMQAEELLESPGRLRASWADVMRTLEQEGYEANEFALLCRVHLNLLDNCGALLEVLDSVSGPLTLPGEKLRAAAAEIKAQQDEIRPLFELASSKPPPLDIAKLAAAQMKFAGEPTVEVGELIRQVQAAEAQQ